MSNIVAKPFLKWAGGKTQLLAEISKRIPKRFYSEKSTYVEPFVGSGAVLFWVLNEFPKIEHAIINDINADLVNCYQIIASQPIQLISLLNEWQGEFHAVDKLEERRREYYSEKRTIFNSRKSDNIHQAALFIFLNKTCFNGLYRVNRKNEYNVPIGRYTLPTICQKGNILAVHEALKKVEMRCGDFEDTLSGIDKPSLFYLDPPYKPLSQTSSFNTYAQEVFDDAEQERLRNFCNNLDILGHHWILSNSDVTNYDSQDPYFDILYDKFNIERVKAKRFINSKGNSRGEINELLISNGVINKKNVSTV